MGLEGFFHLLKHLGIDERTDPTIQPRPVIDHPERVGVWVDLTITNLISRRGAEVGTGSPIRLYLPFSLWRSIPLPIPIRSLARSLPVPKAKEGRGALNEKGVGGTKGSAFGNLSTDMFLVVGWLGSFMFERRKNNMRGWGNCCTAAHSQVVSGVRNFPTLGHFSWKGWNWSLAYRRGRVGDAGGTGICLFRKASYGRQDGEMVSRVSYPIPR